MGGCGSVRNARSHPSSSSDLRAIAANRGASVVAVTAPPLRSRPLIDGAMPRSIRRRYEMVETLLRNKDDQYDEYRLSVFEICFRSISTSAKAGRSRAESGQSIWR